MRMLPARVPGRGGFVAHLANAAQAHDKCFMHGRRVERFIA